MATEATDRTVRSLIPARLDRLPWSPFHTRLVLALGVAWVLDGLEITVASAIARDADRADHAGPVLDRRRPDRDRLPASARWSVRCSSAGCPTGSAGANCS